MTTPRLFGLTVFADLLVAVTIGVILATLHCLLRMAFIVEVQHASRQELRQGFAHQGFTTWPPGELVYAVGVVLFWRGRPLGAGARQHAHRSARAYHPATLGGVHRHHRAAELEVIRGLHERGVRVLLAGASGRVEARRKKWALPMLVGRENVFKAFSQAIATCRQLSKTAKDGQG
jgi:SulP family sulfate permease